MANQKRINGAQLAGAQIINPKSLQPREVLVHTDAAAFENDFEPAEGLVLIRMLRHKPGPGEVELPEDADDGRPKRGQIIKVGPPEFNDKLGSGRLPMDERIRKDQTIYPFIQGGGHRFKVGKQTYIVCLSRSITGFSSAPPESL